MSLEMDLFGHVETESKLSSPAGSTTRILVGNLRLTSNWITESARLTICNRTWKVSRYRLLRRQPCRARPVPHSHWFEPCCEGTLVLQGPSALGSDSAGVSRPTYLQLGMSSSLGIMSLSPLVSSCNSKPTKSGFRTPRLGAMRIFCIKPLFIPLQQHHLHSSSLLPFVIVHHVLPSH